MSRKQDMDKKKMLRALAKSPIVEVACKQISLPRTTYYRWRKDDEEFAEACDVALEESAGRINDLAESQLISAIKEQNMTAITEPTVPVSNWMPILSTTKKLLVPNRPNWSPRHYG
jgi:hypothetical protein